MKAGAVRNRLGTPRKLCAAAITSVLVFVTMVCDPPGKPKPETANTEEITDFDDLYGNNCAGCHSADGKSGPGRPLNNALYLAIIPRETLRNTI
jgi:cytochrome c oxidase cbb3-type subunit III